MFYDQTNFNIRCEWGLSGVRVVGAKADVIIIVDVLSFSTCVDIAISLGGAIYPYRWKDDRAKVYADGSGAELAVRRGEPGKFSLSPASMLDIAPGTKIVLPSPNGSELTAESALLGRTLITGCFRNCQAVARFATMQLRQGSSIAVIPAGERWPDGSLRPAAEDLAAAGAIIAGLSGTKSPEALAAQAVWDSVKNGLGTFLATCSSGRELIERGSEIDVELAGEINVSPSVPILREGAYVLEGNAQKSK